MRYSQIKYPDSRKKQYVPDAAHNYLSKYSQDELQIVKVFTNPDNYAWYAMTTYVQGKPGEYPQRPLAPKELPPSLLLH